MKTPTCEPPQKYFPNRLLAERQPLPVLELAMNSKQYTNSFSASRMIHDRCLIDCHVLLVNADMESNRFCAVQFRRQSEGQTLIHILCYTLPINIGMQESHRNLHSISTSTTSTPTTAARTNTYPLPLGAGCKSQIQRQRPKIH